MFYYRIFDDKEELNFFKSSLAYSRIRELMAEYEKSHQEYINKDFISYLKEHDPEAEIIEVTNIYY
jgi:aminoglycoside phosphotransferase (APT) family kinase protein